MSSLNLHGISMAMPFSFNFFKWNQLLFGGGVNLAAFAEIHCINLALNLHVFVSGHDFWQNICSGIPSEEIITQQGEVQDGKIDLCGWTSFLGLVMRTLIVTGYKIQKYIEKQIPI